MDYATASIAPDFASLLQQAEQNKIQCQKFLDHRREIKNKELRNDYQQNSRSLSSAQNNNDERIRELVSKCRLEESFRTTGSTRRIDHNKTAMVQSIAENTRERRLISTSRRNAIATHPTITLAKCRRAKTNDSLNVNDTDAQGNKGVVRCCDQDSRCSSKKPVSSKSGLTYAELIGIATQNDQTKALATSLEAERNILVNAAKSFSNSSSSPSENCLMRGSNGSSMASFSIDRNMGSTPTGSIDSSDNNKLLPKQLRQGKQIKRDRFAARPNAHILSTSSVVKHRGSQIAPKLPEPIPTGNKQSVGYVDTRLSHNSYSNTSDQNRGSSHSKRFVKSGNLSSGRPTKITSISERSRGSTNSTVLDAAFSKTKSFDNRVNFQSNTSDQLDIVNVKCSRTVNKCTISRNTMRQFENKPCRQQSSSDDRFKEDDGSRASDNSSDDSGDDLIDFIVDDDVPITNLKSKDNSGKNCKDYVGRHINRVNNYSVPFNVSQTIQSIFRRKPVPFDRRDRHSVLRPSASHLDDSSDSDACMESSYSQIMNEENRSARIGMLEDLQDLMDEEQRHRLSKSMKGNSVDSITRSNNHLTSPMNSNKRKRI